MNGDGDEARRYRTILADPPWDIQQKGARGAIRHYPLMGIDAIKGLPVSGLAQEDAHLWLWTTNGALEQAYGVARAWGFTPRSLLTWVKPRYTLGVYLRNATEQVIFATRGKAPIRFHGQATWLFAPLQEHSHKPEEMYAIIERCSPGPYLELFARRARPGWDAWGDQVDPDISFAGIRKAQHGKEAGHGGAQA
jgi:N6-adenosine-specific RNA methylase IME4